MNLQQHPLPDAKALAELPETVALLATASAIAVRNDSEYVSAGELSVEVQTRIKRIEDFRDRQLDDWRESRREALAAMDRLSADYEPVLKPLRDAKLAIVDAMKTFRRVKDQEARMLAEKSMAAAALEAEEERREREKLAAKLEKKGLGVEAGEVRARAPVTVAPVAVYQPPPPRVKGLAVKREKRGRFNLQDQYASLGAAIARWNAGRPEQGLIPHNFWLLDEKALQKEVRRTDGMVPIPGVEFYDHEDLEPRKR